MEDVIIYPSTDFTKGEYFGIPVLYHEGYRSYRSYRDHFVFHALGVFTYHLRHGDEGDFILPVSIEPQQVSVNYCGFIVSPVDLFDKFPDKVVENEYILLDEVDAEDMVFPGEDDGYYYLHEVYPEWLQNKDWGITPYETKHDGRLL